MKILSIKQPYAVLIVAGIKPIEFRNWQTNYRGRILIHSSTSLDGWTADIVPPSDMLPAMPVFKEFYANHKKGGWTPYVGKYLTLDEAGRLSLNAEFLRNPARIKEFQLLVYQTNTEESMIHEHAIVGHVVLTDCVPCNTMYHWIMADPVWYEKPIFDVSGKLGLWNGEYHYTGAAIDYTFDM